RLSDLSNIYGHIDENNIDLSHGYAVLSTYSLLFLRPAIFQIFVGHFFKTTQFPSQMTQLYLNPLVKNEKMMIR
ncbi:hypothetical protein ACJX0J_037038, partial [Zea mays]